MKTIINPLLIFIFIFFQTALVFSQNHNTVVTLKKYNFSVSVMGGESIFTNEFLTTGESFSNSEPNLNASFTYYLSDSKALKVDAGYTFTKSYSGSFWSNENYYEDGSKMFSLKASFLVGRFKPEEHFMFNFSLGLGVHVWKEGRFVDNNYGFNLIDSSWYTDTYTDEPQSEVSGLVSMGASVGYRFIKGFGICAEAEYDLITGTHHNYFPVRAGVFYIF